MQCSWLSCFIEASVSLRSVHVRVPRVAQGATATHVCPLHLYGQHEPHESATHNSTSRCTRNIWRPCKIFNTQICAVPCSDILLRDSGLVPVLLRCLVCVAVSLGAATVWGGGCRLPLRPRPCAAAGSVRALLLQHSHAVRSISAEQRVRQWYCWPHLGMCDPLCPLNACMLHTHTCVCAQLFTLITNCAQ